MSVITKAIKASPAMKCLGLGTLVFALGYATASLGPDLEYELRSRMIEYQAQELSEEEKMSRNFEDSRRSCVLPADLDRNGHVNNSRFIRELNFSRKAFFLRMGVWQLLRKQKRNMLVQAQTIRYRKALSGLLRPFRILTRVIGYSDTKDTFYVESRFVNEADFVLAIHHCLYKIVKSTGCITFDGPKKPSEILRSTFGMMHLSTLNVDEKGNNIFIDLWAEANEYSSLQLNPRKGSVI
jgi:acyl-CoA thioesterase FadM